MKTHKSISLHLVYTSGSWPYLHC